MWIYDFAKTFMRANSTQFLKLIKKTFVRKFIIFFIKSLDQSTFMLNIKILKFWNNLIKITVKVKALTNPIHLFPDLRFFFLSNSVLSLKFLFLFGPFQTLKNFNLRSPTQIRFIFKTVLHILKHLILPQNIF